MARAISELSRSSTSIEMWGCWLRKAASAFGRYSERPDVLARKRTVAFTPRAKASEIAAHRLDIVDHDPGMIEQAFAGRRQLDAASAARQQRYAERLLQPLDPLARRGQREMHSLPHRW